MNTHSFQLFKHQVSVTGRIPEVPQHVLDKLLREVDSDYMRELAHEVLSAERVVVHVPEGMKDPRYTFVYVQGNDLSENKAISVAALLSAVDKLHEIGSVFLYYPDGGQFMAIVPREIAPHEEDGLAGLDNLAQLLEREILSVAEYKNYDNVSGMPYRVIDPQTERIHRPH